MSRIVKYIKNGGTPEPSGTDNPIIISGLNNDETYSIQVVVEDDDTLSEISNAVQGTPEAVQEPEGFPIFPVPTPTIMSRSSTGETITIQFHIEDLSDSTKLGDGDMFTGLWDTRDLQQRRGTLGPVDTSLGSFSATKARDIGETSQIVGLGHPFFTRSVLYGSDLNGASDQKWIDAFTSWNNALNNAGMTVEQMGGVIIADEPYANQGYNQARLEEVIDIGKGIFPEGYPLGFTITYGSIEGTTGANQGWPRNADFIHVNHYPFLDNNSPGPPPVTNESQFKSTSFTRGLPQLLNKMAELMESDGIDPDKCRIGVTAQAFAGPETIDGQTYTWVWPPMEAPIWWADVINNWNDGAYTDRGYKIDALMWWPAWRDSIDLTGMRDGNREYFNRIKKIDPFNRSPVTINEVRVSWLNRDTGVTDYATVSVNSANSPYDSYTITGLDPDDSYMIWVQSIVNGELSGASNYSVRQ